jgi:ABC-type lipoprotein export system ATPase subunit
MSQAPAAIVAEEVRPSGPDRPPLDCHVHGGGIVAVLGPRAWRHDYLRILGGADLAAHGRLFLLGHDVAGVDAAAGQRLRRRIGYIAPYLRLLSVINGWSNVLLAARYHGVADEAELAERARALIEPLRDAGDALELPTYMAQLQQMHLTAARALMLLPDILFAEDVFRGLEEGERQRLGRFLAEVAPDYAGTIVVGTDDTEFARDYADRIIVVSPDGHGDFADRAAVRASAMASARTSPWAAGQRGASGGQP